MGGETYTDMAKNLIRSIHWHSPLMPVAVITDRPMVFDCDDVQTIFAMIEDDDVLGLKLRLPELSPFIHTIFVDADCLVTRDISNIWGDFFQRSVTVWGWKVTDGIWYVPIKPWRERMKLEYIVQHNSGVILFDDSATTENIFSRAHDLHRTYSTDEFPDVHGLKSDEPALGVALAEAGLEPIDDGGRLTRTYLGMTGRLKIDVVAGICHLDSYGSPAEPAIFHACAWRNHSIYKREATCLWLATILPRPLGGHVSKVIRLLYLCRSALGVLRRYVSARFSKSNECVPIQIYDSKLQEFLAGRRQT